MKALLLPAILALVVGMTGSAGYAVMHARTAHAIYVVVQDSISRAVADSIVADSLAVADSVAREAEARAAMDAELTPADSIRALLAAREADLEAISRPATAAKPPKNVAAPSNVAAAVPAPAPVPEPSAADVATDAAAKALAATSSEVIPEKRLAKIFGSMSARDAAKVLEQMSDSDVRTILAMMADRQTAAILAAMPASRAAIITKGGTAPSGSTP